mmetsp:Transcript_27923/g.80685  ORF Transcript_27923/g.80685 Transcript_27923/m.80685 type:complete len:286 (-) Transcript_27923:637-1494(-)
MPNGHSLLVIEQSEEALVLDDDGILLLCGGVLAQLSLDGINDRGKSGSLVGSRYGAAVVKVRKRSSSSILGSHLHQPQVFNHFCRISIGIARKVNDGLPSSTLHKGNLLFGKGVDIGIGSIIIFRNVSLCSWLDRYSDVHRVERIAFQSKPIQKQKVGIGLGSVRDVNLLHLAISSIGVQDDLFATRLEEPISYLSGIDVGTGKRRMIDKVSVRNHRQSFALSHVAQTNGTGKEHCKCPYPVLVGEVFPRKEIGILVTEGPLTAEQGIVFPLELHLHTLRRGHDR